MKISLDWIKDYIDLDLPVPRLIEVLDSIGLLTEGWEEVDGDVVLDIETYANRPDTLGHLGVARELAAALGTRLKEPAWPLTEINESTSDLVDVQIWDEDLCPRYSGIVVKGIPVRPSPEWLSRRIRAMGLKPINNVVDVTNYVLFSTAHPIHAFDLARVEGKKIIIRRANKKEVLRSLEGDDIELSPEMLVIADEKKPIALAGVIGGENSAVSEETRDVFIESACFDPVSVRKTRKAAGIETDASYRFERGADMDFPPKAAVMAASLLSQMGGGVSRGVVDVYPNPRKTRTVMLRRHRVDALLGVQVEEPFIEKTLRDLGFQVDVQQKGIWKVRIPHFRVDIEREADMVEEIARFYGYENIPAHIPPLRTLEKAAAPSREKISKIRETLFQHGMDEVVNLSFMDPERAEVLSGDLIPVPIRNPISSKAALMRTTLIGGLLENILWNRNRGADGVHIFEIGKIFFAKEDAFREQLMLGVAMTGRVGDVHWRDRGRSADFFKLKGACEAVMRRLRYEPLAYQEASHPRFREGVVLSLHFKGERIGVLGLLKQELLKAFDLDEDVWAAELNLDLLFAKQAKAFEVEPVPKYPSVIRDVSFIADRSVPYQDIREAVERLRLPHLERFYLYDRFSGASIPRDKVSLSFRFVFRHQGRTLQAAEVDRMQEKIVSALRTRFQFHLREGGEIDK